MCGIMLLLFTTIPKETSKLSDLMEKSSAYSTPFHSGGYEHIIVCGTIDYHTVLGFLSEFYHEV